MPQKSNPKAPPNWLPENGGVLRAYVRLNGETFESRSLSRWELESLLNLSVKRRLLPQKFRGNECFEVAAALAASDKTCQMNYVEGYVYHPRCYANKRNTLIHHAWIAMGVKVIDFMRSPQGGPPGPAGVVLGEFANLEYFGVRVTTTKLAKAYLHMDSSGQPGSALRALIGLEKPEYTRSCDDTVMN